MSILIKGWSRKAYSLIVFFLGLVFSSLLLAEQKSIDYEDVPDYVRGEPDWHQKHRLYRAYLDRSNDRLSDFFFAWSDKSQPISDSHLKKTPLVFRHVYTIFEDFYQPKNLSRIGNSEWGEKQFSDVSYFVIQPEVDVVVSKKLIRNFWSEGATLSIFEATLKNFKPRIQGETKALYLDEKHEHALKEFLGEQEAPAGYDGIMSTSKAVGESKKRQEFLNQKLKIYHGHWGGWRLVTDPTITTINFNEKYDRAIVHFSLVYEGGEAIYELKKGRWVLIKSELTWIT